MPKRRNFSLKSRVRRALDAGQYSVYDKDGLPVHTGYGLSKTEALKMAKEARAAGDKGVHVVREENPARSLPRNKWVNAKVMVTSGGKIKAKIAPSSLKQNGGPNSFRKRKKSTGRPIVKSRTASKTGKRTSGRKGWSR